MADFWLSCGHHLLDRDDGGGLLVTDEFLKAYLARPELAPPPNACVAERSLHAALLSDPRRPVAIAEIAAIADADARENWTLMTAFRDHLVGHKTVEAAYLDLVRRGVGQTPPLFINQLVHVILRNLLDRCDDVFMLRAAELFFRPQRLTVHDGSLIAADEEKVTGVSPQPASPLVAMLGLPVAGEIDVLNDGNAESYWERSDLFDMALDLTAGRRGLDALGKVIEQWIPHLLSIEVEIESLIEATDVNLAWYVGLDAEATGIGDALWTGGELDQAARERIIGLYRLVFRNPQIVLDKANGEPIYLILAMTPERMLRMKPQNLVTGLPIAHLEAVSWCSAARRRARGSISPGSRSRCWPGCLTQRRGLRYRKTATGRPFMPAPPRSSSIAPRPPITATISTRARPCFGLRCGRPASSRHMRFSR